MKRLTTEDFIIKARKTHKDKYDYSKTKYIKQKVKVCIICKEHGEFWQNPNNHINGNGCPKCFGIGLTTEEYINKVNLVHNNKYDYSKTEFKGMADKICVICPEHGEFWILALNHIHNKQGCSKCSGNVKLTNSEFIEKAKITHNNKYDYSKVKYKNRQHDVCIVCPEHGEFWQRPCHHLKGHGCPVCNESYLEKTIRDFLDSNDVAYVTQYRLSWLGKKSLDFYLPDFNIGIECQGEQHFKPVEHFGGYNRYIDTINRDLNKKKLCNDNGIEIVYVYDKKFKKHMHDNEIVSEIYDNSTIIDIKKLYCFWK